MLVVWDLKNPVSEGLWSRSLWWHESLELLWLALGNDHWHHNLGGFNAHSINIVHNSLGVSVGDSPDLATWNDIFLNLLEVNLCIDLLALSWLTSLVFTLDKQLVSTPLELSDLEQSVLHDFVVDSRDRQISIRQVAHDLAVWTVILVEELFFEFSSHFEISLGVAEVIDELLSLGNTEFFASDSGLVVSNLEFDLEVWRIFKISSLQLNLNLVNNLGLWLCFIMRVLKLQ